MSTHLRPLMKVVETVAVSIAASVVASAGALNHYYVAVLVAKSAGMSAWTWALVMAEMSVRSLEL